MNLEVRTMILHHSLNLEDALNNILIRLIDVKAEEPRTLGHKGSAFTFSSKANLLYDLEKITKEEYSLLFCFMEIRNQFIHNLDADSFTKVMDRVNKKTIFLDSDSELKELIKNEKNLELKENLYLQLYSKFYKKLIELLIKQYQNLIADHERKRQTEIEKIEAEYQKKVNKEIEKMQEDYLILLGESIEKTSDILEEAMNKAFQLETGFSLKFQGMIQKFFREKIKEKYPETTLKTTPDNKV